MQKGKFGDVEMLMVCKYCHNNYNGYSHTVDGRNPAPVDMVNIPLFT